MSEEDLVEHIECLLQELNIEVDKVEIHKYQLSSTVQFFLCCNLVLSTHFRKEWNDLNLFKWRIRNEEHRRTDDVLLSDCLKHILDKEHLKYVKKEDDSTGSVAELEIRLVDHLSETINEEILNNLKKLS